MWRDIEHLTGIRTTSSPDVLKVMLPIAKLLSEIDSLLGVAVEEKKKREWNAELKPISLAFMIQLQNHMNQLNAEVKVWARWATVLERKLQIALRIIKRMGDLDDRNAAADTFKELKEILQDIKPDGIMRKKTIEATCSAVRMQMAEIEQGLLVFLAQDHFPSRNYVLIQGKAIQFADWVKGKRFTHPVKKREVFYFDLPEAEQKEVQQKYNEARGTGRDWGKAARESFKSLQEAADWLNDRFNNFEELRFKPTNPKFKHGPLPKQPAEMTSTAVDELVRELGARLGEFTTWTIEFWPSLGERDSHPTHEWHIEGLNLANDLKKAATELEAQSLPEELQAVLKAAGDGLRNAANEYISEYSKHDPFRRIVEDDD